MTIAPPLSALVITMFSLFCKLARACRSPYVKLSRGSFFWDSLYIYTLTVHMARLGDLRPCH